MKCLVNCYSTTGNTRLVANRIGSAMNAKGVDTVVVDPVKEAIDDFTDYDIIGFGTPTMAFKPSLGFYEVLGIIPAQKRAIPSFVFCTSGGQPVNTLRSMTRALTHKNFVVLDGLEINAETNFPVARPFGAAAYGLVGKPDEEELAAVAPFADKIVNQLKSNDIKMKIFDFRVSPLHLFGSKAGPRELRSTMGKKSVDKGKCTQCATCALSCVARAITLQPYPVFSNHCIGCWACYNLCPNDAITTIVSGGRGRYKGPAITR